MDKDYNETINNYQLHEFQKAFLSVESLEEFYLSSIKNINNMKNHIESEYSIGLYLNKEIQRALDADNKEKSIELINNLNNAVTNEGYLISDYISFEYSDENDDFSISYSFTGNIVSLKILDTASYLSLLVVAINTFFIIITNIIIS